MTSEDITPAIRLLLDREEEAWNRGDAAAYGADFIDGCWATNIRGEMLDGIQPFILRHEQIFTGIFRGSRLKLDIVRLRLLDENVALVETDCRLSGFQALPPGVHPTPEGHLLTRLLQVLVRQGGAWRIAVYHNIDVKPLPQQAR
jgi:uncharacterized protein (TIGR02246 family)